jgi:hypothetical protein
MPLSTVWQKCHRTSEETQAYGLCSVKPALLDSIIRESGRFAERLELPFEWLICAGSGLAPCLVDSWKIWSFAPIEEVSYLPMRQRD